MFKIMLSQDGNEEIVYAVIKNFNGLTIRRETRHKVFAFGFCVGWSKWTYETIMTPQKTETLEEAKDVISHYMVEDRFENSIIFRA